MARPRKTPQKKLQENLPLFASYDRASGSAGATYRDNTAATIIRTRKYTNIEEGVSPFIFGNDSGYGTNSDVSTRDAIYLCQKAYWNIPIFGSTINLIKDFAMSDIYWVGGNDQSKNFFEMWGKKVQLDTHLQNQFYTEYFRSSNIFLLRVDSDFDRDELLKLKEIYAADLSEQAFAQQVKNVTIKYYLLNPADISVISAASYFSPRYIKVINSTELQTLKNPQSELDKLISNGLQIKDLKRNMISQSLMIEVDTNKLITVFNNKQDYEPMAVPIFFSVLDKIDYKLEMEKMDAAIARSVQQAVLHVAMGDKENPPSPQMMKTMQTNFQNGSINRVVITDGLTKISFVLPDIAKLLNPEKYTKIDEEIKQGLNNVLFSDDKFSNAATKMKVFLTHPKRARAAFLKEFLIPEVERIGRILNFKSLPEPRFKEELFDDDQVFDRIVTSLSQYGFLTPEGAMTAIETGRLPTPEENEEQQKKFRQDKDKGLFTPVIMKDSGGEESSNPNGRPRGTTGIKQSKPRIPTPIGQTKASYDFTKIIEASRAADKIFEEVKTQLKKKLKVKKITKDFEDNAFKLTGIIIANEEMESWESKIPEYLDNPSDKNINRVNSVIEIAAENDVDHFMGALLLASQK